MNQFESMINLFQNKQASRLLRQAKWGVEKESQRITPDGELALTDHPAAFGDKLEHPTITTDFAESQLELITPPLDSIQVVIEALDRIHDEAEAGLGEELLWPLSMPPKLPPEPHIRIASFNDTPEGREKEAYRRDLAARYGTTMQMISGLHVNFSLADPLFTYLTEQGYGSDRNGLKDELYFALTRNFLRYRWLLIYLYGASPNIHRSFESTVCDELAVIESCCPACCRMIGRYEQYASSLRVSRYGYSNTKQKTQMVSFNSKAEYVSSFRSLIGTVLKKESELYSSIRVKARQPLKEGQLASIERNGVDYIEVRILDLNPYERTGVGSKQLHLLHLFLLYCFMEESPPITKEENERINENHHMVSLFGRKPDLKLRQGRHRKVLLTEWAQNIFDKMEQIAAILDQGSDEPAYMKAWQEEKQKLSDPGRILSARMLSEMKQQGETFVAFGLRRAKANRKMMLAGRP